MLLRRRLPVTRLLRQLQTGAAAASTTSSSPPPPPLQKPIAASASPSTTQGSRLGFPNAKSRASSSKSAAFLAAGAAAALAALPVVSYADANEEGVVDAAVSTDAAPVEDLAGKERKRIMELIESRGMQAGSYPKFEVAIKGQKVVIKFNVPSTCNISLSLLISEHILDLRQNSVLVAQRCYFVLGTAARQITLNPPKTTASIGENNEDSLCILIFEPLVGSEYAVSPYEIEFIKPDSFSSKELEGLVSALKIAGQKDAKTSSGKASTKGGEDMGVRVYGFDETSSVPMDGTVMWENIAGYEHQKREIEDTVLLALQNPQIYDDIARGTRCKFETNRPRAVLFEGPPGTGKTSSARVIAKQAGVPLLYVPLEIIMSKYYGESERLLGSVFSLANNLPDGGIIFLDEVDSFAISRDSEMHEATRRILSVILRQVECLLPLWVLMGSSRIDVVVIAATNRKEDLDPALISRFDSVICFGLPDQQSRAEIAAQYAKHLTKSELVQFSLATEEMAGRDIRDICMQAERHWASKFIRGQIPKDEEGEPPLPPIDEYVACAEQRRKSLPDRIRPASRSGPPLKLA
ncbi:hypothetical protein ZWY2020_027872 [Hordeum vulgare]|nr:hypothetical protein ZWY2020_027872 [Hordeum vulgare]